MATDPAHRIGSLFFNFGGPGGPSVDFLQNVGAGFLATLNERFDLVTFDPRRERSLLGVRRAGRLGR
ncbi:hypothetical protein SAMN05661080_04906 [Modestobacter sp. DSM 44400]|uniref:hypothetical protein n=1 Tax=Modestobacter sp. DSM 44400 TaxID=1550230 RepID=UPI00089C651B|nr:hypothetical protein [Modestobacter sp. DSM 44400]SDY88496.1 hypothetical protein SAMN05661080_04906 [Modestobacter sp. DSM 44400]